MNPQELFKKKIGLRFDLYSSFLANLPFSGVKENALLYSLFQNEVEANFSKDNLEKIKDAFTLVQKFFKNQKIKEKETINYLFKFIQILERKITLFDAIEEAMFDELSIKDSQRENTIQHFLNKVDNDWQLLDLADYLQKYKTRIVLTAHPTQFYPLTILGIIEELSSEVKKKNMEGINNTLKQLAYTSFLNKEKPTPLEEASSIIIFLKKIFYEVIPDLEWEIKTKLKNNLPKENYLSIPSLIEIGFWPGGDRDGNPFVTHQTTKEVAWLLKQTIIKCYINDLKKLRRKLTFKLVYSKINLIIENLKKILDNKTLQRENYSLAILQKEVQTIKNTLKEKYDGLALDLVEKFSIKVQSFGYHFSTIDVRQHSKIHHQTVKEIILQLKGEAFYQKYIPLTASKKMALLNSLLEEKKVILDSINLYSNTTQETLKTLEQIFSIQKSNGEKALNRYIISNNEKVEHIIEVFFLLKLTSLEKTLAIDIIPLFESITSLTDADKIMDALYKLPDYQEHLKHRHYQQTIMLGYSDGTKDGGYLTANWSIYLAKEKLSSISNKHKLKVVFFDGRGGPPSRGGGNTHKFYTALSNKISSEQIQLTIQGQTISSNFGNYSIAKFNLAELFTAGLKNHLSTNKHNELSKSNREILNFMSEISRQKYLDLINHKDFVSYLFNFTPIAYFGESNIGSRPSKRNNKEEFNLSDLRAIPFVSSWNQIKQNIPAFYGLGTALEACKKKQGLNTLVNLYEKSLFFRTLIGNATQSLLKTNFMLTIHIDKDPHYKGLWQQLLQETQLTEKIILEITKKKELYPDSIINRESILVREKIVQPLLIIQQYALINLYQNRQGKQKISPTKLVAYKKMIIRSLAGIINAARNSA